MKYYLALEKADGTEMSGDMYYDLAEAKDGARDSLKDIYDAAARAMVWELENDVDLMDYDFAGDPIYMIGELD